LDQVSKRLGQTQAASRLFHWIIIKEQVMRYLSAFMGAFVLFCAIINTSKESQAFLYSASALNFCMAIMPKDK